MPWGLTPIKLFNCKQNWQDVVWFEYFSSCISQELFWNRNIGFPRFTHWCGLPPMFICICFLFFYAFPLWRIWFVSYKMPPRWDLIVSLWCFLEWNLYYKNIFSESFLRRFIFKHLKGLASEYVNFKLKMIQIRLFSSDSHLIFQNF